MKALGKALIVAGIAALWLPVTALAHPHVFVTVKSEIVYEEGGLIAGVRHAWTFDDAFSSYAVQGLDKDGDSKLSRDELQPLAQTNVESLKEFDYFTYAKMSGKKLLFQPPKDYWLEQKDALLVLHFFLPLNGSLAQGQNAFVVEIFDPTYFVAFAMADQDPVHLSSAPQGCLVKVNRPKALDEQQKAAAQQLDSGEGGEGFGAQFANYINVNCP